MDEREIPGTADTCAFKEGSQRICLDVQPRATVRRSSQCGSLVPDGPWFSGTTPVPYVERRGLFQEALSEAAGVVRAVQGCQGSRGGRRTSFKKDAELRIVLENSKAG